MRSSRLPHAAAGGLAFAIVACAPPPGDAPGLAGTYVMSMEWNADTLVLRADGRYVRRFTPGSGPAAVDSGRWTIGGGGRRVVLHDFPKRWAFVHDLMGDTTRGRILTVPQTVTLTITRRAWGTVRLGWYPEFDWWFVRRRT